jgi:alkanesulfonate monooxygenase SsuD/methylene tetrahydromethanopterin reductase-like flavin-dependent oxidoreductase (luciferase family)
MADHSVSSRTRFQLLKEQLKAIQTIWATDESEFHGRFVNFDKMKAYPKPHQHPHPPIVMGGEGEKAIECAAEICDGWAPWFLEWPAGKEKISYFKQKAAEHGRDPDSLEVSLFEKSLPEEKTMAEMERAGVNRIILTIDAQTREETLPTLDALASANR